MVDIEKEDLGSMNEKSSEILSGMELNVKLDRKKVEVKLNLGWMSMMIIQTPNRLSCGFFYINK
ncbi:hypothetical protein BpHYR1_007139 [Brachionus plicatilis]|uniref:Uncharacterized protein n=1 Tax=Brachionus plicatilis TaxID=10195 RepID=A0A3M7SQ32_BRAPC|nr:hypothetical protein BpHYR1_007139 [Brachionus plicatilis]